MGLHALLLLLLLPNTGYSRQPLLLLLLPRGQSRHALQHCQLLMHQLQISLHLLQRPKLMNLGRFGLIAICRSRVITSRSTTAMLHLLQRSELMNLGRYAVTAIWRSRVISSTSVVTVVMPTTTTSAVTVTG